jgi:hypothetical protein
MKFLLSCLAGHALLAQLIAHPWWTPNLTIIGLTVATIHTPSRWLVYAAVSGMALTMWMLHGQGPLLMTVLVLGWLIRWVAGRWQATDGRVQTIAVLAVALVMTLTPLAGRAAGSWRLLGLVCLHVMVTMSAWLLLQRVMRHVPRDGGRWR